MASSGGARRGLLDRLPWLVLCNGAGSSWNFLGRDGFLTGGVAEPNFVEVQRVVRLRLQREMLSVHRHVYGSGLPSYTGHLLDASLHLAGGGFWHCSLVGHRLSSGGYRQSGAWLVLLALVIYHASIEALVIYHPAIDVVAAAATACVLAYRSWCVRTMHNMNS